MTMNLYSHSLRILRQKRPRIPGTLLLLMSVFIQMCVSTDTDTVLRKEYDSLFAKLEALDTAQTETAIGSCTGQVAQAWGRFNKAYKDYKVFSCKWEKYRAKAGAESWRKAVILSKSCEWKQHHANAFKRLNDVLERAKERKEGLRQLNDVLERAKENEAMALRQLEAMALRQLEEMGAPPSTLPEDYTYTPKEATEKQHARETALRIEQEALQAHIEESSIKKSEANKGTAVESIEDKAKKYQINCELRKHNHVAEKISSYNIKKANIENCDMKIVTLQFELINIVAKKSKREAQMPRIFDKIQASGNTDTPQWANLNVCLDQLADIRQHKSRDLSELEETLLRWKDYLTGLNFETLTIDRKIFKLKEEREELAGVAKLLANDLAALGEVMEGF